MYIFLKNSVDKCTLVLYDKYEKKIQLVENNRKDEQKKKRKMLKSIQKAQNRPWRNQKCLSDSTICTKPYKRMDCRYNFITLSFIREEKT